MRDLIANSWRRCQEGGVNALQRQTACVHHPTALDGIWLRSGELRRAAKPVLARMSSLLRDTGSVAVLCDSNGVILEMEGDLSTRLEGERIHLATGAVWSELAAGTNGIGTSLATGEIVIVRGEEHYCEGMKKWDSAAALLHDPADAVPIAGFGLFGLRGTCNSHWAALVSIAAALIHSELTTLYRIGPVGLSGQRGSWVGGGTPVPRSERCMAPDGRRGGSIIDTPGPGEPAHHSPAATHEAVLPYGGRLITDLNAPAIIKKHASKPARSDSFPAGGDPFPGIIGTSPAIQRAKQMAWRLASVNVPTLLRGPTGVGKEVVARAIHEASDRRRAPFIAVNCGAIPRDLLGSELFGFSDGAFTGARRGGLPGKFEAANGGTLFLDEIGEMGLEQQPYLLRAVENGEIFRIGETRPRKLDVRILAATNRRLEDEVSARRFREDLLFRLSVTTIDLPQLRDRHGDIPLLVAHFARKAAERHGMCEKQFSASALSTLEAYNWPGNVRELNNLVEQITILSPGYMVAASDLPPEIRTARHHAHLPPQPSLDAAERTAIINALRETGWNVSRSARLLGIAKSTLYLKIARYGLRREQGEERRL